MKLFGGWKWNVALAVFGAFTTLVVCWPRPSATSGSTIAQRAPTDISVTLPSPAVPSPTPAEHDSMLRYTVQEGDTVAGIARLFVVSEDDLRRANQLSDDDDLTVGRMIWIPAQ